MLEIDFRRVSELSLFLSKRTRLSSEFCIHCSSALRLCNLPQCFILRRSRELHRDIEVFLTERDNLLDPAHVIRHLV